MIVPASPMRPASRSTPITSAPADIAAHSMRSEGDALTMTEVAIDMRGKEGCFLRCETEEASDQMRPKMRVPLVPPKPNEFLTAMLIGILRAVLAQ